MPKNTQYDNSILLVSGSEQFDAGIKAALPERGLSSYDRRKTATLARRALLDKHYDLIIINAPLPDEIGYDLALDLAEDHGCSIVIATPPEIYDSVWDYVADKGILVIMKPAEREQMNRAIRFLLSIQDRLHVYEEKVRKTEDKMEELKLVSRAKILLMEKKHLTEKEAHRMIGKEAMDHGVSRKRVAESIIDSLG